MKWNDIVNHMKKKSATSVVTPPISSVMSDQTLIPTRMSVRKWIPLILIFSVIIAGGVIVYFIIKNQRSQEDALLTKEDARYIDEFFKTNPPASLTSDQTQNIEKLLDFGIAPTAKEEILQPETSKNTKQ